MAVSTIGKPVPRIEGAAKVTGGERYAADIHIPGALHAKVLRATVAHVRIKGIDTSRASAFPGVHAVLTGADVSSIFVGQRLKDMPILAVDRVRFAGEAIAAVAAESTEIADEALGLIDVDLEELPAVFDPLEAMEPGASILHDDPSQYKNAPELPAGVPNLQGYNLMENGELEAAFAQADRVFEHRFRTQLTHHGYLEPHACTARVNADGAVEVWASNKWPYVLRSWLADDLGIPANKIKVHIMSVGGDFGGKSGLLDVPLCVLLAQRTGGRPVKLVMTYAEELISAARRHPAVITLRTGVRKDGTLAAIDAKTVFGGGGYGAFKMSPQVTVAGARQVASCYRVPAIRIENFAVYTNHPPCTQTRSPGAPQIAFAVESQMDLIARELGLDPVDFRMKNLLHEGEAAPLGQKWEHIRARETLERAVEASSWGQPKPSPTY
jgi:CO/xanthine dehydrogenase Mo-binding subunit